MLTGEGEDRQGNHFVRSTLGEIPVIGPFFLEKSLKKAVPKSLHSSFMLMGGVLIMAMDPFHLKPKTLSEKIGSGTAHMVVGMWFGAVAYHAAEYTVGRITSCLNLSGDTTDKEAETPLIP